jgi:hypothetical protein
MAWVFFVLVVRMLVLVTFAGSLTPCAIADDIKKAEISKTAGNARMSITE